MPQLKTLVLGQYRTNCYLLWQEGSTACAVIDPGYFPERILDEVSRLGLHIDAILLTHGHFDHVGAVKGLADAVRCPVWLCEKELSLPDWLTDGPLYYTDSYEEGDIVPAAGIPFSVLETPGHTPGSVCLKTGDLLFTGDTLFAGSCGRMDLGGSPAAMAASLQRLARSDLQCTVYPGHGGPTTLERERRTNPYMKGDL